MRKITLPMDLETIQSLHAGDAILLSGTIYSARDAAHKRIHEGLENGNQPPFILKNATIYYVGPTPASNGRPIGSAGPTTSSRMDVYTPELLDLGLQAMIGKGKRSQSVKDAIIKNKAVYFVACGGAGALLSHCIIKTETVAYEELLAEAVVKMEVKDFPVFVGIDSEGKDIYDLC